MANNRTKKQAVELLSRVSGLEFDDHKVKVKDLDEETKSLVVDIVIESGIIKDAAPEDKEDVYDAIKNFTVGRLAKDLVDSMLSSIETSVFAATKIDTQFNAKQASVIRAVVSESLEEMILDGTLDVKEGSVNEEAMSKKLFSIVMKACIDNGFAKLEDLIPVPKESPLYDHMLKLSPMDLMEVLEANGHLEEVM